MTEQMKSKIEAECEKYCHPAVFETAIDWFLKNVWHDARTEIPNKDKEILALVVRPNMRAYVAFPEGIDTLCSLFGIIKIEDVSKWCYIDDLFNIPDTLQKGK
jgi:hypothetical protein